jgi:hypothetical protein
LQKGTIKERNGEEGGKENKREKEKKKRKKNDTGQKWAGIATLISA